MAKRSCLVAGQTLTDLRTRKAWSQERLAEKAKCDPKVVIKAEAGGSVDLSSLGRIAQALDVEPDTLMVFDHHALPVPAATNHASLPEMRPASAAARPTGSAPPPPGLFIGRDEVVAELRQRLLPSANQGHLQMVTAVRGWPGVGKTTVAAALAHDQVLADAFPDGLLWASIGQKPDLIGQLDLWARELGGMLLERQKLSVASSEVASMLRQKRMLLIVDDVWTDETARPFLVGGVHCSTIITTRLTKVAEDLGLNPEKQVYRLNVLNEEQSLDLLKELAPKAVAKYYDQCCLLVRELEFLPLALHVAGRLIQSRWFRGFSVEELLLDLRSVLGEKPPATLDGSPSPTVSALLRKSTDVLGDELRYCFACLGCFAPKPATFTTRAMGRVWELNDPSEIAGQLIDHGLLEPAGPGRYQMHALLVLHAKSLLRLATLHQQGESTDG